MVRECIGWKGKACAGELLASRKSLVLALIAVDKAAEAVTLNAAAAAVFPDC
jgi:hypothetical protein